MTLSGVKFIDCEDLMKTRESTRIPRYLVMAILTTLVVSSSSFSQWIQQISGTPENLVDVIMIDSMKALIIGDRNGILLTTDAGSTWFNESAIVSATYQWNSLSFYDALHGTIVGDRRIVTTTDGGLTWTLRNAPSTQKCLSVLSLGAGSMYVGDDSGWMYSSSDTGKTWASAKISTWPILSIFLWTGVIAPDAPIYYAITPHSICTRQVYPTPQWNEAILPNFRGLGSQAFNAEFSSVAGFIVGVFGDLWSEPAILRRPMTDTTWSPLQLTSLQTGIFSGISAPSANVVYVCGSSGMIYKTSNGGDTWTPSNSSTTRNLNALYFWNEKRGFAVGDSGTILYTDNGDITRLREIEEQHPENFSLSQNYPNPFNPSTMINYRLSMNSYVTLRVYDVLGREVTTLVNERKSPGVYRVEWYASGQPSGVYYCRLQSGTYSETRKLILLR